MTHADRPLRSGARYLGRFFGAALLVLTLSRGPAAAQSGAPEVAINDADPESSVPSPADAMKNPLAMSELVMELAARAEQAEKKAEFARAALYHRALAKAVPNRATAHARACEAHDKAGQWEKALETCRAALGKEGVTVADSALFVRVMLKSKAPLATAQIEDLDAVIEHLDGQIGTEEAGRLTVADLKCQVAVRLEDAARLGACVKEMQGLAPKAGQTFVYASLLALKQHDWDEARSIIERARKAGLPAPAIRLMEERLSAGQEQGPSGLGGTPRGLWLFGVLGASLLIVFAWLMRRRAERRAA
jgi:tetratricopeptide (TPR) repeat protein